MIITDEIFEQCKSVNGGWSKDQMRLLGETEFKKGWRNRLLGKDVPEETIRACIELRNRHIVKHKDHVRKKCRPPIFEPVNQPIQYREQYLHPNWQKMRLKVLSRDNFQCLNCGSKTDTLHVHHLKYLRGKFIWEVPIWYLVTLCDKCHSEEHGRDLTAK